MTTPNAPLNSDRDANIANNVVILTDLENAFAHDFAIDMAERLGAYGFTEIRTREQYEQLLQRLHGEIMSMILMQFGRDFDSAKAELIFACILRQTMELSELNAQKRAAESALSRAQTTAGNQDRFVRLIPGKSFINDGFWKKLDRAVRLSTGSSTSGSGYNLKAAHQVNDPNKGLAYKATAFNKQDGIKSGFKQMEVLGATIEEIKGLLEEAKGKLDANEVEIEELQDDLKSVQKGVKDTFEWVDEFETALKIQQFEEELNADEEGDKSDIFSSLWGRRNDPKFAKAYAEQAAIEAEIVSLERKVKKLLGVDLTTSPIASNENATGVFNAATITLKEFQDRQTHLQMRMGGLAQLIDSRIHQVEVTQKSIRDDIAAKKLHQADYKKQLKGLKGAEKNYLKIGPSELERLFWYNFGGKITMIRDWQKRLPVVNRMGATAYRAHTTAISREYGILRDMVVEFEEKENINGMLALLDRELGTIKVNGSLMNPRIKEAQDNLSAIQAELERRKQRRMPAFDLADVGIQPPAPMAPTGPIPPAPAAPNPVAPSVAAAAPVAVSASGVQPAPAPATNVTVSPAPIPAVAVTGAIAPAAGPTTQAIANAPAATSVNVTGAIPPATSVASNIQVAAEAQAAPVVTTDSVEAKSVNPNFEKLDINEAVETVRPVETMIVGDLNGSLDAFQNALLAMKSLDVDTKGNWNWTGGNRKLVLIGDILFDRVTEGLQILRKTRLLREQAKADKGSLEVIFGNHEDIAVSFLTEREVSGMSDDPSNMSGIGNAMSPKKNGVIEFSWQGEGMLEFVSNWSNYGRAFKGDLTALKADMEKQFRGGNWTLLNGLPTEIRLSMQNSESGRQVFDEICQMKLVVIDGDAIIFHTEPTEKILAELTSGSDLKKIVQTINHDFQVGLRALLFEQGVLPAGGEFTRLCNIFTHPDNRNFRSKAHTDVIKEKMAKLAGMAIKRIVHGHTTVMTLNDAISKVEGVELVNVDLGAGRPEAGVPKSSVAVLDRMDKAIVGADEVVKIAPFDPDKEALIQTVDAWVDEVFPLDQDDQSRDIAENLIKIAKLDSKEKIEAKLTQEMKNFLGKIALLQLADGSGLLFKANIGDLVAMINFYNEWFVVDKASFEEKMQIIKDFDLTSPKAVFDQWRDLKKTKPEIKQPFVKTETTPGAVKESTSKALAEAAAISTEPPAPETPPAKRDEAPATVKPINQMSEEELKKKGLAELPTLLGVEANESKKNAIMSFVEAAEAQAPAAFKTMMKSICIYPQAIKFLFTGKLDGKKIFTGNKPKPISSGEIKMNINDTNVTKILTKPETLAKVNSYLEKNAEATIVTDLSRFKDLGVWFNQLGKK